MLSSTRAAAPASSSATSRQIQFLETQYIKPTLETILDVLRSLNLSQQDCETLFARLLQLIRHQENITQSAIDLNYGNTDEDLKEKIKEIFAQMRIELPPNEQDHLDLYTHRH